MRPHRLRIRAFGPFPDEVEVDLDRLADAGLFLLHGDTGAGKTTLLDALGFALYGQVPGARRGGRLRSDQARAGVRTEVQLEVTLGGRRWRVTRSPAQERPKTRGSGTVTEQARVLLEERRADAWETVSTRIDEAASELDPLLGMSADQFFQVVLLPQGEFARFLRAGSADRGALLQRLFATERFQAVEDWLAARRTTTTTAVRDARQQVAVLRARYAQAAGIEDPADGEMTPPSWAPGLLARARAEQAAGRAGAAAARAEGETARAALEAASAVADRQARRRAHEDRAARLAEQGPVQARLAAELADAGRAAEAAGARQQLDRRQQEWTSAQQAEGAARAQLSAIGLAAGLDEAALQDSAEEAARRAGLLEGLHELASTVVAERAKAGTAQQEAGAAQAAMDRLQERLSDLPTRLARTAEAVLEARAAQAGLSEATALVTGLAADLADATGLQAATAEVARLREERLSAAEERTVLRDREVQLRSQRYEAMIAELADLLTDDGECPVCGSREHPSPYLGTADRVTVEQEDAAREAADAAGRVVAALDSRSAVARATVDTHTDRLAGRDGDPTLVAPRLAAARSALTALRGRAEGLTGAEQAAELARSEQSGAAAEQQELESAHTAALRRAAEAAERAETSASRLTGQLDGAQDLDAAIAVTAERTRRVAQALTAVRATRRAGEEAGRAEAEATAAAHAAGFADLAAVRSADRPARWRAEAQERRAEHDRALAAVTAALADPDLDLPLEPPADVDGASRALRSADDALSAAEAVRAGADTRATDLGALAPELAAVLDGLAPLEEAATRARSLADLCAGTSAANTLRMSLTSFVLAARLEDVAGAASLRLLRMTQGRYSLVHTDGAARGGARSGLGLLARDTWTGQDRDTATLSGGETFLAALALALGLADVVQAEAGGARIEALFVDEGFGTLDEQTLDEVMDVLDGLREGGRVVGVVSHVAELRTRIPAQVRVTKGRAGSRLELIGC